MASALLAGVVEAARETGAPGVEAYPIDPAGNRVEVGAGFVGIASMFDAAGFRRVLMTDAHSGHLPHPRPPRPGLGGLKGKLIYSLNVSLDGYVETPDHSLEWASIDEECPFLVQRPGCNDRRLFYGRRMYELMAAYWPTAGSTPSSTPAEREFAQIWRDTPKVVFSSTLASVDWNGRLVRGDVGESERAREFDGDLDIGGATRHPPSSAAG